jgi:hypothetical protein
MDNILKFDKNYGKQKTRKDLNFDKVILFDENEIVISGQKKHDLLQLLYDCTMPDIDEISQDIFDILICFKYQSVADFLQKSNFQPFVTSFTANTGKELFDNMQNIHSYDILCIVQGSKNAKIDDLLCIDKPFVNNLEIAVKIKDNLDTNFQVTAFHIPIQK